MKKITGQELRKFSRNAWMCFCLSYFLFYDQLRALTNNGNRMETAWTPIDMGMVYVSAGILGLLVFGVWWFSKRAGCSQAIRDRGFVLISFFSLGYALHVFVIKDIVLRWIGPFEPFNFMRTSDIYFYKPFVTGLLRYVFFLLFAYGMTVGLKSVKKYVSLLILVVSPVTLVYPLVALSYDSIPMRHGALQSHLTGHSDTEKSIYFFLFDMWDYQNTFRNKLGPLELPGLEKLGRMSTLYHDAITPSTFTDQSIRKIIGEYHEGSPNIFTRAREVGWKSYIVAAYLPYQIWYGSSVDYCLRVVWYKMNGGFTNRVLYELKSALDSALSFWAPEWAEPRNVSRSSRRHLYLTREMHKNVMDVLRRARGGGLYYFHYPIPHWPFFGEPELRSQDIPWKESQARGYRNNLEEMDKCIEDIIEALKGSHQWNNSLIIFTGDHGWRMDPLKPRALIENKHVPLYIKFPKQKIGRDIYERYDTENLKTLIEEELIKSDNPV